MKAGGKALKDATASGDIISSLPDALLLHIFSFMYMVDVVKTGVLSRRWEHLWKNSPNLSFQGEPNCVEELQKESVGFITKTLFFHESNIIIFHLDFVLSELSPANMSTNKTQRLEELCCDIDRCIRRVARKNVQLLSLDFSTTRYIGENPIGQYPYKLPCNIFINDTIKSMRLNLCIIRPTRPIQWKSLKKLLLYGVELSEELVKNILNGSPLLRHFQVEDCRGIESFEITTGHQPNFCLELIHCNDVKNLSVTSSSLEYLNLFLSRQGSELKISAPCLRSLKCRGDIAIYQLTNVSSLVEVEVAPELETFVSSHETKVLMFIESVSHAKELQLYTQCIQLLSMVEVKSLPIPVTNINKLKLKTNLTKWDLPGVFAVLKSCHKLMELVVLRDKKLKNIWFDDEFLGCYDFDETNYLNTMLRSPYLMKMLEYVQFDDFTGRQAEIGLVEFLLQKSPSL